MRVYQIDEIWYTLVESLREENRTISESSKAEMLARIFVNKYAYHLPKNRIKRKLRNIGTMFSKSTLARNYRLAARLLMALLVTVFLDGCRGRKRGRCRMRGLHAHACQELPPMQKDPVGLSDDGS